MRLFDIRCDHCGWSAPLPLVEAVAVKFKQQACRDCESNGRGTFLFRVKERIVVGPTKFFPSK